MRPIVFSLACLTSASWVLSAAANESQKFDAVISVSGEGEAAKKPDTAIIRTGVVSQAESAKDALDQNNAAMEKIMSLLKEQGIAERDIQTTSFNVNPVYEHDPQGRKEPDVVAYRVHNEVQVRLRDLDRLGQVLDALVRAGSNRISGVSFEVDDRQDVLQKARCSAIENAKSRAETYASAAGVNVGRVLQISEQPLDPPRPMRAGFELRSGAASSVPVAEGEQEFRVTVNVVYELKQSGDE